MPRLSRTVATAAAAALLAACPVVASAADAHPLHSHPSHSNTHRHSAVGKLTGPRRGASHAIAAQLKAVKALGARAGNLTIADAAALQSALSADADAVQSDLDGVATADSVRALHALMTGAITSRQVARLQFEVVVAADATLDQMDALATEIAQMQGQLSELNDVDMPLAAAALIAASDSLSTLIDQAHGAVAFILNVSSTATRAELHNAIVQSDEALQALTDGLAAVQDAVIAVQTEYGL
jgi:hypothetical protein